MIYGLEKNTVLDRFGEKLKLMPSCCESPHFIFSVCMEFMFHGRFSRSIAALKLIENGQKQSWRGGGCVGDATQSLREHLFNQASNHDSTLKAIDIEKQPRRNFEFSRQKNL